MLSSFNQSLFQFIYGLSHRNIFLDDLGIFFAQYLAYLLVLAFLLLVFYQDGWRKKVYLFCEGAIAVILARGLVTEFIRFFYHEARPFSVLNIPALIGESGWSFPSGHMTWFFALAMVVWYANHKWGIWFFILSAIMGLARIYVGVHWPFDILGGAIIGIYCAMLVHYFFQKEREAIYAPRAVSQPKPDPAV